MKPIIQIFEMCLDKPEEPFQLSLNKINSPCLIIETLLSNHYEIGADLALQLVDKNIEVFLICSNTFSSGVIFKSFKFSDWALTEGYTTNMSFKTFQPS